MPSAPKDKSLHRMPLFVSVLLLKRSAGLVLTDPHYMIHTAMVKWFCFQGVKYNLHRLYYTQVSLTTTIMIRKKTNSPSHKTKTKKEGTVFMFLTMLHATEKDGQLQQTESLIFLSHSAGSEETLSSPLSLFSTASVSLATNICRNNSCVVTKICLSQQKFCHDKHTFVATKDVFCHKLLSRQKWYLWHLPPMIPVSSCFR